MVAVLSRSRRNNLTTRQQRLTDIMSLEGVLWGFFQEDVASGPVSAWTSRGWRPKAGTQSDGSKQPTKETATGAGVKFPSGGSYYVLWDGEPTAQHENRWGAAVARANMAGNPSAEVTIGSVNTTDADDSACQPRIYFKASKMGVQWRESGGPKSVEVDCDTAPGTWNWLVWFRRGGWLYACVNGTWGTPVEFRGCSRGDNGDLMGQATSFAMDMWIDSWVMGQSEVSDEVIDKVIGLVARRASRVSDLISAGHKYGLIAPRLLDTDFNNRWIHYQAAWADFQTGPQGTSDVAPPNVALGTRHNNRGDAPAAETGWEDVYREDFLTNPLADPKIGDPTSSIFGSWFIGAGASVIGSSGNLAAWNDGTVYIHDPSGTGSLKIRMLASGATWYTGSLSTTMNEGQGRVWAAPSIFEVKFRFIMPDTGVAGGLFPAVPWRYNRDKFLGFRTRSPLELDDMEADGHSNTFHNITMWTHDPDALSNFRSWQQRLTDSFEKVVGYDVTASRGFDANLNWWDGNWHTIKTVIDGSMVYGYLDEQETFRDPASQWWLEPYNLIIWWALKDPGTAPAINTAKTYDLEIDYIRVAKTTASMAVVPASGFTARPSLSGSPVIGETLTLTSNAVSTRSGQLQIRWYLSDGTPLVGETGATLEIPAAADGLEIWAHVINMGIKDKPEAWTAHTATITSGTSPVTVWDAANKGADIALSNGDRDATNTTGIWDSVISTTSKTTGLLYAELLVVDAPVSTDRFFAGICLNNNNVSSYLTASGDAAIRSDSGAELVSGDFTNGAGTPAAMSGVLDNDVLQIAINWTTKKGWYGINDDYGDGDPAADTNPHITWTTTSAIFLGLSQENVSASIIRIAAHSSQQVHSPPTGFTSWDP